MKESMLKQPLITNLKKRNQRRYDFYYLTYGQIIKKRRLELKKTQEEIACSICSNTYISKAENNQVVMGDDQLNLIMERLDIPAQDFINPEKMVYYLEKVVDYYYYRDLENYQKLIDKIDGFHFHALVELIKLGYFVLKKEYHIARNIYNQLLDYLNSLDDFAFCVFLIFSADLCLKTSEYQLAKFLIDSINLLHLSFDELSVMYLYTKFRVYGRLDLPRESMKAYHELISKVIETGNNMLLDELILCKALFDEMYAGEQDIKYLERVIKRVDPDIVDEYLVVKSIRSSQPGYYIDMVKDKESEKYLIALYFLAKHYKTREDHVKYEETLERIDEVTKILNYDIDFLYLLDLDKKEQWVFYKEYLVNPFLKTFTLKQNIFAMRHVSDKIIDVLKNHNRYKDALNYSSQCKKKIKKIQYGTE